MGPTWGPCHLRYKYRTTMSPFFANSPQRKKDMLRPYHVSKCGWPWSIFFLTIIYGFQRPDAVGQHVISGAISSCALGPTGWLLFLFQASRRVPSFSLYPSSCVSVPQCGSVQCVFFPISGLSGCSYLLLSLSIFLCFCATVWFGIVRVFFLFQETCTNPFMSK